MSTVSFVRRMVESGFSYEDALRAAEAFEATVGGMPRARTKGAERQARYEERKRQKASEASESVTTDEPLSPSPPPQTPPPRPHTRGNIYPTRESGAAEADFDVFWAAYPDKVGKKAARKAWDKASDKPPLAALIAALDLYVRTKPPDRDYCHASTWLNEGRWDDQPAEPSPRQPARLPNASPDRFAAKQSNYDAALAGSEWADQVLVARRGY